MVTRSRALRVSAFALAAHAGAAAAQTPRPPSTDILVTAQRQARESPQSRATIDAATLATTVNAANVEDALKYLPSLIVRKRHIGDTQAPLATRTTGLGASARTLIYADGALLSALIGNNNTTASPRWSLVSPQEIARIDVLYGPFAAAYPGNSIGAVVEITTRSPERLEVGATLGTTLQRFRRYATRDTYPAWQGGATIGDRFGPLALFASAEHVDSTGQPLGFATILQPVGTSAAGTPVDGAVAAVNRTGAAIQVLGATGIEHQRQDRFKLKAALDISPDARLSYVGGLFLNHTDATAESYLTSRATGQPAYAGTFTIDGRSYAVAASAFSGGVYRADQRHWSHALTASGASGRLDWRVVGTRYRFDRDIQRSPTALPAGTAGGAGTITRLDGSGWDTLDASLAWRGVAHDLSAGAHVDRFGIDSRRYATADWIGGGEGALDTRSRGRTRTAALWVQDAWRPSAEVTVTLGGRGEWWRAYDGLNIAPAIARAQPERQAARFSPKAALAWTPAAGWTLRLSYGDAWRLPTVGELYQVVTTPVAAVPDPDLRPEHARSQELAAEHRDGRGLIRLALFNEVVRDALISQAGPLNGTATLATFVQNVDRTRARGVELAVQQARLLPGFDLSGSVTYADATTRANAALPAAVGRLLPQVPRWKASVVGTWRPASGVSLTAAGRVTSRLFGTLDNSDFVGDTYQGFGRYLVIDARAVFDLARGVALGIGVDNLTDDRYFLFHPFPQRAVRLDLNWKL